MRLKRKFFEQESKIEKSEQKHFSVWVQNSMKGQNLRKNNAGRVAKRVEMG